jgi:hypothetical protein
MLAALVIHPAELNANFGTKYLYLLCFLKFNNIPIS